MKIIFVSAILFAALNAVSGDCPGAVDYSCKGFSALEILVTGGQCRGTAVANCEVVTRSQTQFNRAFAEWWSKSAKCEEREVEIAATAIATAVAMVWANVVVEVACGNQGFACGWLIANTKSYSVAFAEAIAHAGGDTIGEDGAGFCFADIRSMAGTLAEAATHAQETTCATAGDLVALASTYVETAKVGVTQALLRASAEVCGGSDAVRSSSRCSEQFESSRKGTKPKMGELCGGAAETMACVGGVKEICCLRKFNKRICSCPQGKCQDGPWIRKSNFDDATGERRSFRNARGDLCFCTTSE